MAGEVKVGEMFFELVGRDKEFRRMMDNAQSTAQRVGRSLTQIGGRLTAAVSVPLAGAGAAAVKFASDLEEVRNKTNEVFGAGAQDMLEFSKTSAQSMGMAGAEALELGSTLGLITQNLGFTRERSQEVSKEMLQLAADVASFRNVQGGAAAVTEAMTSALVGERERLKMMGIVITEAQVKTQMLANGTANLTGEALAAAKAEATLQLIREQAANDTGDFARTSDSLANQLRILRATAIDLAGEFGEVLIPYAKDAAQWLGSLAGRVSELDPRMKTIIVAVAAFAAAIGPVLLILGQVVTAVGALSGVLAALSGPVGIAVTAIGAVGVAFTLAYTRNEEFRQKVDAAWASLREKAEEVFPALRSEIDKTAEEMGKAAKLIADEMGKAAKDVEAAADRMGKASKEPVRLWDKAARELSDIWRDNRDDIMRIGGNLADALISLWDQLKEAGSGIWENIGDEIMVIADILWRDLKLAFYTGIDVLEGATKFLSAALKGDWQGMRDGLKTIADALWNHLKTKWKIGKDLLAGLFGDLTRKAIAYFVALYNGAKTWLVDKIAGLRASIDEAIDKLIEPFRRMKRVLVGNSIVPDMVNDIRAWIKKLDGDALVDPATAATEKAAQAFEQMNDSIVSFVTSLVDRFKVIRFWARETGDEWGAMSAEADTLKGTIDSLIQQGLDPQSTVIQELTSEWRMLTASVEGHAAALEHARQQTEAMTDAQREQQRLLRDFQSDEGAGALMEVLEGRRQREADEWRRGLPEMMRELNMRERMRGFGELVENALGAKGGDGLGAWALGAFEEMQAELTESRVLEQVAARFGNVSEEVEETDTTLERMGSALSEARRWMTTLGVAADSAAGRIAQAAQVFVDFGGGALGWAGALASALGIDIGGVVEDTVDWVGRQARSVGNFVGDVVSDIGDFFGLADGGTITSSGMAWVGERGPELVHLPRGARVQPLDANSGGAFTAILQIDGREVARGTAPHLARVMHLKGVTG